MELCFRNQVIIDYKLKTEGFYQKHIFGVLCVLVGSLFDVLKKTNTLLSLLDNNIAIILKLFR